MPTDWKTVALGELTTNFDGQRVPVKESERKAGPYPYYGASGIVDYVDRYIFDGEYLLIAEDGENLRTQKTPIAFLARGKFWVNNHAHIVTGSAKADTRFLMYALNNADIRGYLTGSTMPKLTQGNMNRIPILAPPPSTQRAIAQVLGMLDDKIELNHRMNETLEAMANSRFRSLFVDTVQYSLPKGWRKVPFTETVEILGGGTPKTSVAEYWNGDIPWFSVVDAPQHSDVFVIDTEKKITNAGIKNSSTNLLPVGTTIISARGTVGKIALVGIPMAMNQSCYGLRGKAGKKGFHTYFATRNLVSTLQQRAHGSVFDTITRDTLAGVQTAMPPAATIERFEEVVSPLMERIQNNIFESHTLGALRDALLPKLLSGELHVPQAKQTEFNVIPCRIQQPSKSARKTTEEFVEAIVIAQFTRGLSNATHPLGRKRYNKCAYLAHRKAEHDVTQHYLKKAAGPYSPWAKYQGPEKIACKNGYVKNAKVGDLTGFVAGDKIAEIDRYVPNYPICAAVDWVVGKFKFRKNDDLELLATVDYAALDLIGRNQPVSFEGIKHVIATNKEWAAKLKREIFSDANIKRALAELHTVFPGAYVI